MKKLILKEANNKIHIQTQGNPTLDEAMRMLFTSALSIMKSAQANAPEGKHQQVTEMIYDSFNESASATLEMFAPDKELRPDITMEAIKRQEEIIMKEHIAKAKKNGSL